MRWMVQSRFEGKKNTTAPTTLFTAATIGAGLVLLASAVTGVIVVAVGAIARSLFQAVTGPAGAGPRSQGHAHTRLSQVLAALAPLLGHGRTPPAGGRPADRSGATASAPAGEEGNHFAEQTAQPKAAPGGSGRTIVMGKDGAGTWRSQ